MLQFSNKKNYRIKNLSSIKAPNRIFLYYFNLYGEEYLKDHFRFWHPLPWEEKNFDNDWELAVLPENYSGCLNLPLEFSSQLFLDSIQKSPIFLQFFFRFARTKNILDFFLRQDLRNIYIRNVIKNKKFLIPSERLLEKRLEIIGEDFFYTYALGSVFEYFRQKLEKHPIIYCFLFFLGVITIGMLYEKNMYHFYSKLLTICRSKEKLVQ